MVVRIIKKITEVAKLTILVSMFIMCVACSNYKQGWSVYYMKHVVYGFTNMSEKKLESNAEYSFTIESKDVEPLIILLDSLSYKKGLSNNDASFNLKLIDNETGRKFLVAFDSVYTKESVAVLSSKKQDDLYNKLDEIIKLKAISSNWKVR